MEVFKKVVTWTLDDENQEVVNPIDAKDLTAIEEDRSTTTDGEDQQNDSDVVIIKIGETPDPQELQEIAIR
ncbi:hypothetical protein ACFL0U_03040 [Pseudomonadota bacterium]